MEVFFPQFGKNPLELDHANHLKKRTQLVLEEITKGTNNKAAIEKIDAHLLSLHHPQKLSGSDGLEVTMKKQFAEQCIALQTHGIQSPKMLTIHDFYTAIEFMGKKSG